MLPNFRELKPLNWNRLVHQTIQRRQEEGLTQKAHAALAGVSIPTMLAFERGDTTLTLAKAFDILRVVGLIETDKLENNQDIFVSQAFQCWQKHIETLPKTSPARFPHGWYRFDYYLEGNLKTLKLEEFKKILAQTPTYTGWPPFLAITHRPSHFIPHEMGDILECWLKPTEQDSFKKTPDSCDYWQAHPEGRMFLLRGYQEDSVETFPAGAIFDTTLPIWRVVEVLLHAKHLASFLQKNKNELPIIHFRAIYTGLSGRIFRSWSNPLNGVGVFTEGTASKTNEAFLEASIPANDLPNNLIDHVCHLLSPLYEKFGVAELSKTFVHQEIERLLRGKNEKLL